MPISSSFLVFVVSSIWLPLCTQAHMQMSYPYPLRSALDPAVPEQYKDYSMTNPLHFNGDNFPCKHYQYNDTNPQAFDVKATYQAGNSYNLTLAGSATHSGGSCQISLSYDNGATFKVIQSIIGGCPLAFTYDFTIPSFAPSSNSVLLSWSWFNLVGNREMYNNCARVAIQGAPGFRQRRTASRRQTSIDQLPDMFACNVGNGCTTVEGHEVVFPNPGPNVIYGTDAITPQPGPGFIITGSNSTTTTTVYPTATAPFPAFNTSASGPTGTGFPTGYIHHTTAVLTTTSSSTTTSTSSITTSTPTSTSTSVTTTSMPTTTMTGIEVQFPPITITITITIYPTFVTLLPSSTFGTVTSTSTSTSSFTTTPSSLVARATSTPTTIYTTVFVTATSAASQSTASLSVPCVPGTFACNSPSTFSQCVSSGTYVFMGSVAAGMQCVNGQIIRLNAGACAPNGQIFCNGRNAFYMCDQGGLINMGSTAPGTICQNGVIVAA